MDRGSRRQMDRGGNTQPRNRGGFTDSTQNRLNEAVEQKRNAERRSKKVSQGLFEDFASDVQRGMRTHFYKFQALLLTLKRSGLKVEVTNTDGTLELVPFNDVYADSIQRVNRWAEMVPTVLGMPLAIMAHEINKWNSDPANPTINFHVFRETDILSKLSMDNADPSMNKEERRLFAQSLLVTPEYIEALFTENPIVEPTPGASDESTNSEN